MMIREMVGMFITAKEQIRDRIASQTQASLQRVVLYGSGHLAQLAFHALELAGTNIVGICDDNQEMIGHDFCGREVLNPSQIRFMAPDAVVVADSARAEEIIRNLEFLLDRGIGIIRVDSFAERSANSSNAESPMPMLNTAEAEKAPLPLPNHRS
jgi:FlaA1/EpsC-like NDP-sugar epimerase